MFFAGKDLKRVGRHVHCTCSVILFERRSCSPWVSRLFIFFSDKHKLNENTFFFFSPLSSSKVIARACGTQRSGRVWCNKSPGFDNHLETIIICTRLCAVPFSYPAASKDRARSDWWEKGESGVKENGLRRRGAGQTRFLFIRFLFYITTIATFSITESCFKTIPAGL